MEEIDHRSRIASEHIDTMSAPVFSGEKNKDIIQHSASASKHLDQQGRKTPNGMLLSLNSMSDKPDGVERDSPKMSSAPQPYAYFPNDQNRQTKCFGKLPPQSSYSKSNWELEMLKNQRLRMMLRSLGKVAEKYATSVFNRVDYLETSKTSEDFPIQKGYASLRHKSTKLPRHSEAHPEFSPCELLPNQYLVTLYEEEEDDTDYRSLQGESSHHNSSYERSGYSLTQKHHSCMAETKNDLPPHSSRDSRLEALVQEHTLLKHEKQRLQRILCFQLEDRSVEAKRRGFSRPNQYRKLFN